MNDLVLFDIDGVLADDRHRYHLVLEKCWVEYFDYDTMMADPVWVQGQDLLRQVMSQDKMLGYLTGRRVDTGIQTRAWLWYNGFPMPTPPTVPGPKLYMKPLSSKIPTPEFKAQKILHLRDGFSSVILYDDDSEVCRVVNKRCGEGTAILCGWNNKPATLVQLSEI